MASLEFGPGCLKEEELLAIQDGNFEVHSLRMRLEQCASEQPCVYSGSGIIRQASDNRLEFSLYAQESTPFQELMSPLRDVPSGKIIPEDRYYVLTAIDLQQREWVSRRILPKMLSAGEQGGTVCVGEIREIAFREELTEPFQRDILFLRLFDEVKLPYNATTETTTTIANRKSLSVSLDVLHFSAVGYEFYLRKDLDSFLVEVRSESCRFCENIETRIIEALQFVLARPISWSIMTKYTEQERVISIRIPHSEVLKPRIQPPIAIELGEDEPFCAIFDKYLRHIISYSSENLHPISSQMRAICRASTGSINTEALVLCIAVESLLKQMETAELQLTDQEKEGVKKVKDYIKKSCAGSKRFIDRLLGLFGILEHPSASDALHSLVQEGAVTSDQRRAWKKLRRRVAHGDPLSDMSLQELVLLCNAVLVLFYHLVFYEIGYQGKYTDYSRVGWPTREYAASTCE